MKVNVNPQQASAMRRTHLLLGILLLITLIARLWNLGFQSLWLDELHTMNEADPGLSRDELMKYLMCCDQHPPLHFLLSKSMFTLFGHTAFVARIPSAIAGTLSVWAIYLLGKELLNKRLGLIAAILTSVNYFNLFYSQEARNYIFSFLFVIFSFLFFIKLIKDLSYRNSILYAIFTLLLLYSHYYSLFVVASQIVMIILLFFTEEIPNRKKFALRFVVSGIIIGLGYLPWVPYMMEMSAIKSFWVKPVSPTFFVDFFFEYFGNAALVKIPALLLFVFFLFKALYRKKINFRSLKDRPLAFTFFLLSVWIFITLLIPYVRSVMLVPMLIPRYTIVILPAYLIAMAYGIELIKPRKTQFLILGLFVLISIFDIVWRQGYYTTVRKTQFREMVQLVVSNNPENYPVINEKTHWHQQYYFKLFNSKAPLFDQPKAAVIDSILQKSSPQYDLKGFWIISAFGDQPLTADQRKALDTTFVLTREQEFYDGRVQLYTRIK